MSKKKINLIKTMPFVISISGLLGLTIFKSRSIEEIILNSIESEDIVSTISESESLSLPAESINIADNPDSTIENDTQKVSESFTSNPVESQIENPIEWQDENFGKMITQYFGKKDIYPADLDNIHQLILYGNYLFTSNDEIVYLKSSGKRYAKYLGDDNYLLEVESNSKSEYGSVYSLKDLLNFPNLESLQIQCQKNITLDVFENEEYFKNLVSLSLCYCHIGSTSINYLSNLKNLQILIVYKNEITDISSLENLKNLVYLDISGNNIEDISCVKSFEKLIEINISQTKVKDVTDLNYCPLLKNVVAYDSSIEDFSGLSKNIQVVPDVNHK